MPAYNLFHLYVPLCFVYVFTTTFRPQDAHRKHFHATQREWSTALIFPAGLRASYRFFADTQYLPVRALVTKALLLYSERQQKNLWILFSPPLIASTRPLSSRKGFHADTK